MPARPAWALTRGARTTWRRFHEAAKALLPTAWARWLGTLAVGLGVAVGVAFGLVAVGQWLTAGGMAEWDEAVLHRLVDGGPLSFNGGIWWESPGNSVVLIPLLLAASVVAARARRPLLALSLPLAYAGSKLLPTRRGRRGPGPGRGSWPTASPRWGCTRTRRATWST